MLAILYASLIVGGAGLLMTPWAQARPFGWSDAFFTAASAVTVTGLVVLDAGSDFTPFGHAVLMALFQAGGLGLMTFAVLLLSALGLPIGISERLFLRADLAQTSVADLLRLVWILVKFVVVVQSVGIALLCIVFIPEMGWIEGFWFASFHTASAFNSAGFAMRTDSLADWVDHPLINVVVPALFIIGGIGFSVITDVWRTRRWKALSFHSKIMLAGSAGLLVWSVAMFAILEWRNPETLGQIDAVGTKLMASWFQAATTRSAGLSTLDVAGLRDETALMFISLMLIGGGPTSTAGGIKVSTFVVMLMAVVAFFKRRDTLHAFGRSLGLEEALKVLALTMMALLIVMMSTFALLLSHDGDFVDIAFEVASAFGTVGLSRGFTSELDGFGRGLIVVLMFVGRVGPLTLGYFIATRVAARIRYPSAQVYLG
ncbi:MAG: Ktr system potassium transporter B [Rhodobacteraceae bacterium]|nr:MAG: Ktr system potassium transporter B [Paracoccaceae bacterium]